MNLADLKAAGGIVTGELVSRSITWADMTFTILVKRLSYGEVERSVYDPADTRSRNAAMLSESVRLGDDGSEALSYEDAYRLDPSLALAMLTVVRDVNDPKKSKPPTNFGSS